MGRRDVQRFLGDVDLCIRDETLGQCFVDGERRPVAVEVAGAPNSIFEKTAVRKAESFDRELIDPAQIDAMFGQKGPG